MIEERIATIEKLVRTYGEACHRSSSAYAMNAALTAAMLAVKSLAQDSERRIEALSDEIARLERDIELSQKLR